MKNVEITAKINYDGLNVGRSEKYLACCQIFLTQLKKNLIKFPHSLHKFVHHVQSSQYIGAY